MLELIAAVGLVAFIVKHEYVRSHKVSTIPAEVKPIARKRKMKRATIKPSGKRILGAIVEHKIGSAVMPQGYSYPVPFNQPWINVISVFSGE